MLQDADTRCYFFTYSMKRDAQISWKSQTNAKIFRLRWNLKNPRTGWKNCAKQESQQKSFKLVKVNEKGEIKGRIINSKKSREVTKTDKNKNKYLEKLKNIIKIIKQINIILLFCNNRFIIIPSFLFLILYFLLFPFPFSWSTLSLIVSLLSNFPSAAEAYHGVNVIRAVSSFSIHAQKDQNNVTFC